MWFQRRWTDSNYEFIPWEVRLYEIFTKPFQTFPNLCPELKRQRAWFHVSGCLCCAHNRDLHSKATLDLLVQSPDKQNTPADGPGNVGAGRPGRAAMCVPHPVRSAVRAGLVPHGRIASSRSPRPRRDRAAVLHLHVTVPNSSGVLRRGPQQHPRPTPPQLLICLSGAR